MASDCMMSPVLPLALLGSSMAASVSNGNRCFHVVTLFRTFGRFVGLYRMGSPRNVPIGAFEAEAGILRNVSCITADPVLINVQMEISMKLVKKLVAVAVVGMSIPFSAQALTAEQYQNVVLGGIAGMVYSNPGAVDDVLHFFRTSQVYPKYANWVDVVRNVCGASTANILIGWSAKTDPLPKLNIAVASMKAREMFGTNAVCRWTVPIAAGVKQTAQKADASFAQLSKEDKNSVQTEITIYQTQKANMMATINKLVDTDADLTKALNAYTSNNCGVTRSSECDREKKLIALYTNQFLANRDAVLDVAKSMYVTLTVTANYEKVR